MVLAFAGTFLFCTILCVGLIIVKTLFKSYTHEHFYPSG